MISRKAIVALVLIVSTGAFAVSAYVYQRNAQATQHAVVISQSEYLVRMHSPGLGPREAPVTIVEFFDPARETCRAFYPIVKDLLRQYPADVRAHVLGQASTVQHVQVHVRMLVWGVKQRSTREVLGQLLRIAGAATKPAIVWVPAGNTGGANVSPIRSLPIPEDLRRTIERARN
jgi:protein-disulfide isomerase